MLEELHVRDLALIEEAWLEFGPGMTVLTGETGAGKTVLVGALKLLLGERADATLVRSGAAEAVVEGRLGIDGVEHTARRRVAADGRSRCYLDGEMTTVTGLGDALGPLVDLHGQHDHQLLLQPASHVSHLDRFAGDDAAVALSAYRGALSDFTAASAELGRLARALAHRDARCEELRFVVDEIAAVSPRPGEDEEIADRIPRMRHAERLTEASSAAHQALSGEAGAEEAGGEALASLLRVAGLDPVLDEMADELGVVEARLGELVHRLRAYGETVEHDPAALNEAEARLAVLASLKRRHGPTLEDVARTRDAAAEELERLEEGEQGLAKARAVVEAAEAALVAAAAGLSRVRSKAAPAFEARLAEASRGLAMPTARFEVALTALPGASWSADGAERVEFLYAPAAGEKARPLARIASGGEASRVMLALKGVLGGADQVPVLVFDEIDSGIGGAAALAVGERLRALSETHQVLVVTHLAQVAAFADAQLVVVKTEHDGRARTSVNACSGEERVAELARMLSGSVSEKSLAHARELLASVVRQAV